MPLLRYFLYVGGSLLALLFAVNAVFPTAPLPETLTSRADLPPVRIQSERKLPERVVFETNISRPGQAVASPVVVAEAKPKSPMQTQAPVPPAVSAMSAQALPREAFAQLPQEENAFEPKMRDTATVVAQQPKMSPAHQRLKRKVAARPRTARSMITVAQQPRFGGFYIW